jgi:hypothetical protein
MYVVWAYVVYLSVSIAVTVWVAKTLHRNGRVFLIDSFLGNKELADSVNHLLVVGFYLINVGFVAVAMKYGEEPTDTKTSLEFLSTKVGGVLLILGVMHFFNIFVFSRMRKRAIAGPKPAHWPGAPAGQAPEWKGGAW